MNQVPFANRTVLAAPLLFWFAIAFICGCSDKVTEFDSLLREYELVPESIQVGGRSFQAEIHPWADLMPGANYGAVTRTILFASDGQPVDTGIHLIELVLLSSNDIWRGELTDETRPPTHPDLIEATAHAGPVWPPQMKVAGIVEFSDGTGNRHKVRTPVALVLSAI